MYNLNVSLAETAATAVNTLLVETNGPTPRTPEILNSLIAMTNPLDNYFGDETLKIVKNGPPTNLSTDSNSSTSSQLESPTAVNNPPSIQHTCSQLIKAGLKLTIEQKRKLQNDSEDLLDLDKCYNGTSKAKRARRTECSESEEDKYKTETGLTPEDEERRRRRRERNKIAATKCRLKKRERTANLITESETLETQNIDMKNQVHELQQQKQTLEDILNHHRAHCQNHNNIKQITRDSLYKLPSITEAQHHSYNRSLDSNNYETLTQIPEFARSNASNLFPTIMRNNNNNNNNSNNNSNQFNKHPPTIIVEEINDNSIHITNLDNINIHHHQSYYNQCHNYPNQNYNNSTSGIDNGCMA